MLNDALWLNDKVKMKKAYGFAKMIFGANMPYVIVSKIDESKVVFTKHFIEKVMIALSTDSLTGMTSSEREVLSQFIDYQNGSGDRDITQSEFGVSEALDQVIINMVLNIENELSE